MGAEYMGDTNLAMEIRTGTAMAVAFVVLGSCCVAASLESDSAAVTMIDVSAEHQVLSLTEKDAPQKGANSEGANWRVDALKKASKIEASLKDVKKGTKNYRLDVLTKVLGEMRKQRADKDGEKEPAKEVVKKEMKDGDKEKGKKKAKRKGKKKKQQKKKGKKKKQHKKKEEDKKEEGKKEEGKQEEGKKEEDKKEEDKKEEDKKEED